MAWFDRPAASIPSTSSSRAVSHLLFLLHVCVSFAWPRYEPPPAGPSLERVQAVESSAAWAIATASSLDLLRGEQRSHVPAVDDRKDTDQDEAADALFDLHPQREGAGERDDDRDGNDHDG